MTDTTSKPSVDGSTKPAAASTRSIEERVAAIEAQLPNKTVGVKPKQPSLAECNKRYFEVSAAGMAERRDAATMAKKAIDAALGVAKRGNFRQQKDLSPVGAEAKAAAAKQTKGA